MRMLPALLLLLAVCAPAADKTLLRKGWAIQSSADVRETGAALSVPEFSTRAAGTRHHAFQRPQRAGAGRPCVPRPVLRDEPALSPDLATPLPSISPTRPCRPTAPSATPGGSAAISECPPEYRGKTVWLGFDGINFRANVWLNGKPDRLSDQHGGRVASVRIRRDRRGASRATANCAGHRDLPARAARSRHHLRRLEPAAAR